MSLKSDLARDFAEVFLNNDEFAVTALYTHGMSSKEITVLLALDESPDGYVMAGTRIAYIQAAVADVPDIAAGDTLEIDGHVWYVSNWEESGCVVNIVAGGGA